MDTKMEMLGRRHESCKTVPDTWLTPLYSVHERVLLRLVLQPDQLNLCRQTLCPGPCIILLSFLADRFVAQTVEVPG